MCQCQHNTIITIVITINVAAAIRTTTVTTPTKSSGNQDGVAATSKQTTVDTHSGGGRTYLH